MPPQCSEGARGLDLTGVKHALAVGSFFGIWFGLWVAGWLAGGLFSDTSEIAVFFGALFGCVAGAFAAAMIVGDDPTLRRAGTGVVRDGTIKKPGARPGSLVREGAGR
jgi:hypothetical protein